MLFSALLRRDIFASVVLVTSLVCPLRAADYHFSGIGDDQTGDGSAAAPWRTIAQANRLDLEPGDRLRFRGGDTFPTMDPTDFLDAVERVTNPGFEDGLTPWTCSEVDACNVVTEPVYSGNQALQVIGAADSYPVVSQDLDITGIEAGDVLVFRCRAILADTGGFKGKTSLQAGLRLDQAGSKVAETSMRLNSYWVEMQDGWVEFACAVLVPTAFDAASVWYYQPGGTTVVLDDCSVRRVRSSGGTLVLDGDDGGSVDADVVVDSYGDGRAVIDAHLFPAIKVRAGHVTVGNLALVGDRSGDDQQHGFWAEPRDGVTLQDLHIHDMVVSGFGSSGIKVGYPPEYTEFGYDGILIERCRSEGNAGNGIHIEGVWSAKNGPYAHRNAIIRHCQAIANSGLDGTNHGSGIMASDVENLVYEHCYAENNGFACTPFGGGPVGIWAWDCEGVLIQWCEAANNTSLGVDGGGFDLDGGCRNSIIQYCYSHDNKGPGYFHAHFGGSPPTTDNVFRYCVSINDRSGGGGGQGVMNYWGGSKRTHIHNCVVIGNDRGAPLMRRESGGNDGQVFNNIFISGSDRRAVFASREDGGITYRNNIWYSLVDGVQPRFVLSDADRMTTDHFGVDAWEAAMAEGRAAGNLELDPALTEIFSDPAQTPWFYGDTARIATMTAFKLTGASAAIDGGLDPAEVIAALPDAAPVTNPSEDLYGDAAPQSAGWDIGVHEYRPLGDYRLIGIRVDGVPAAGLVLLANDTEITPEADGSWIVELADALQDLVAEWSPVTSNN